jgi:YYY domain-containing protein
MHDPAIDHTEQPMDLMILAGLMSDPGVPAQDPWLSGYAISYYYFGHWLQAFLAQLTGQPPEVAYNLAQAWWLAIVWSAAFGVVYNLLALEDEEGTDAEPSNRLDRRAVSGGVLAGLAVVGAGNLDGTLRAWRLWLGEGTGEPWWWFRSSRVLEDRAPDGQMTELITEFPAFSFLLGDNHPHLLALPLVLLAATLALNGLLAASRRRGAPGLLTWAATPLHQGNRTVWLGWGVVGLAAGAPIATNSWDAPLVWLLLALPACWSASSAGPAVEGSLFPRGIGRGVVAVSSFWAALAVTVCVLFFPYFLTAQNQARGWLPNLLTPTPIGSLLLVFGVFLPSTLLVIVSAGRGAGRRSLVTSGAVVLSGAVIVLVVGGIWAASSARGRAWLAPRMGEDGWASILSVWLRHPFTLVLLTVAIGVTISRLRLGPTGTLTPGQRASWFALVLAALGLLSILVPEIVFLHDLFETRVNTVFKFYYQAWVMLALAGAFAITRGLIPTRASLSSWSQRILASVGLALLLASLAYPLAALRSKVSSGVRPPTLDGLSYLGSDERAAIEWVRRSTDPRSVVLQAPGESYRAEDGRLSAAAGRATLLGWQGHEVQWRGARFAEMAAGRLEAAELVYRSGDRATIEGVVKRFGIDYIYLGPVERRRYSVDPEREQFLRSLADSVFMQGSIHILETNRQPRGR